MPKLCWIWGAPDPPSRAATMLPIMLALLCLSFGDLNQVILLAKADGRRDGGSMA